MIELFANKLEEYEISETEFCNLSILMLPHLVFCGPRRKFCLIFCGFLCCLKLGRQSLKLLLVQMWVMVFLNKNRAE